MPSIRHHGSRKGEEGVVVVLFSMFLVVLLGFGALVYTGAQALVLRRQLQNAGDAAALAAANLLIVKDGCSAAGDGGAPRAEIVSAARTAVTTNFPGFDLTKVVVTCPTGYLNAAVQIDLSGTGPSYFGSQGLNAATSSTAVNGQVVDQDYAVILLDPMNASWPSQRNGCASFLINGGITMTFEKSVIVDSKCTLADSNNGAVKALNNSFQMNLINGAEMRIGGEYSANTVGHINPAPLQRYRPLMSDPLAGLQTPDVYLSNGSGASLPTINMASTGTGICKNQDPCILPPGTYPGGIGAAGGSGPSTLLLRPGVYYVGGGGVKLKSASARIIAIPDSTTMTDAQAKTTFRTNLSEAQIIQNWENSCPINGTHCGVMVYNAPSGASWVTSGGTADEISNGSQGVVLLRAYNPAIDEIAANRVPFESYSGLVIWQARTPVPTASAQQPAISMAGGACVIMSGTVYAPGGQVTFGGSSCGAGGGGETATTLQFIVWDLTLSGNNNFYFAYQKNLFAAPLQYGLIK
jgi:Flp pilus assembly protein TadG